MQSKIIRFAALTASYLVLRAIFFHLAFFVEIGPGASAWYPPTGLSFAFVAVTGWIGVPFTFIPSSFLATGSLTLQSTLVIPQAISMSAAALIWRFYCGNFRSISTTTTFILIGLVSTTILSFGASIIRAFFMPTIGNILDDIKFGFWLGDASGILLCTPFFFFIFKKIYHGNEDSKNNWGMFDKRTAAFAISSAIAALIMWRTSIEITTTPVSAFFLLILPIAVLANRFGFGAAVISAFATNFGLAIFAHILLASHALIDLQIFMLTAGLTGLILGALGSNAKDIQETNVRLLKNNEHLTQGLETISIGMAVVDLEKSPTFIIVKNLAFENFIHEFDKISQNKILNSGFDGDSENKESGKIFNWLIKPALSSDGMHTLVVIVRDVTDIRRQQLIQQHQSRLAAVGEMAGGIAHEINNLLHPILNLARYVRKNVHLKDEQVEQAFTVIERSATKAASVVHQILDFSHQSTPKILPTNICKAIKEALNLVTISTPPNFKVHFEHDNLETFVNISPSEVTQIVANIVINAVHATNGKGDIFISTNTIDEKSVIISFEDSGPGVNPAIASKIFDPFFTTKPHGEGTGLGLAKCKEIVISRGGTIIIDTLAPHGARIVIRFPAV